MSIDERELLLPWLQRLQERNLELRQYEHTPLATIQGWGAVPRQLPLFETLLVFENYPVEAALEREQRREDLKISHFLGYSETNYPLALGVLPGRELGLHASYDGTRFEPLAIRRLLRHLTVLLRHYATAGVAARPLGELALLARGERHQILREWSVARTGEERAPSVGQPGFEQLFAARSRSAPDAVAVADPGRGRYLTYGRLRRQAKRVAGRLARHGVAPEVRVGLRLERSIEQIVAMLGVLEAGGAYVALEPAHPLARQRLMLEDSGARLLLVDAAGGDDPPPPVPGLAVLDVSAASRWPGGERRSGEADRGGPRSPLDSTAYVIYTSGSSGRPKGVEVTRRSLAWYALTAAEKYGLSATDRVLQFSPVTFDISVEEIFPCLACGATLVLRDEAMAGSVGDFYGRCRQWSISSLFLPTAFWHELAAAAGDGASVVPASLRRVAFGGEQADPERVAAWLGVVGSRIRLFDTYGPTETTVVATACELSETGPSPSPAGGSRIGRPIAGAHAVVADRRLRPLPIHVPGELVLGGAGVARGYLGRPALTAARFVPDAFADFGSLPGRRLYLTGDRARLAGDGNLEFVGRIDDQVKVRGFRVEPGEIVAQLRRHPAVRDAFVTTSSSRPAQSSAGRSRLVAYVVPAGGFGEPRQEWMVEQVSYWQTLHDDLYFQTRRGRESGDTPPEEEFASIGWDSSYTGEPIPAAEMSEWLDLTVDRILALPGFSTPAGPPRVLEVGCGDGMIVDRVAPHSKSYLATDFSSTVLDILRRRLNRPGGPPNVRLACHRADDFSGIATGAYDVVVFSSVVQYFPSIGYLRTVLENAVRALAPGGSIFIGDVRSLSLLPAFCASVELYRAKVSLSVRELRRRIRRRLAQEKELVIDPAFFAALADTLPGIRDVRVEPKVGRGDNELMLFRYDVAIHLEGEPPPSEPPSSEPPLEAQWLDWRQERLTLSRLKRRLETQAPPVLGLLRVPNRRTRRETHLVRLLAPGGGFDGSAETRTVADLKRALRAEPKVGVKPADLLKLGEELSYTVDLSWLDSDSSGSFHALVRRSGGSSRAVPSPTFPVASSRPARQPDVYANDPLGDRSHRALAAELRDDLSSRLPDYMVPAAFVVLERLPTTASGKVDRGALPPPETVRTELDESFEAPRTTNEEILAEIWSEVLGVEGIGARDNYFALGGDSILSIQIVGKAHQRGLRVTPRDLFRYQTVAELAAAVRREPSAPSPDREPVSVVGAVPLLPIQRWLLDLDLPEPWHFNWAVLARLSRPLAPAVLAAAADHVAAPARRPALTLHPFAGGGSR